MFYLSRGGSVRNAKLERRRLQLRNHPLGNDNREEPIQAGTRPDVTAMGPRNSLQLQGVGERPGPPLDAGPGRSPAEDGHGVGRGASVHPPRAPRAAQHGRRAQDVGSHPKQVLGERYQ